MRWVLALLPAIALAMPASAQVRPLNLSDSQEPGSVLIFPKFINRAPVVTAGDQAVLPRTEIEIGVVCPPGVTPTTTTCFEHQTIKIKFHWVCPGSDDVNLKYICPETDFFVFVSINGKLAFSADGTPVNSNSPRVPAPPCTNGYLIAWVVDNDDRPIKWDGLIGDAVLRGPTLTSGPDAGFSTAVEAYSAIPIQARTDFANGALLSFTSDAGELAFDGTMYQAVTRTLYGDVKFNNETPRAASSTPTPGNALSQTWLTLLTLDVDSGFPNLPVFVDLNFYNESLNTVSTTNPNFEFPLSTHTHFICWTQQNLTDIDVNLTQAFEQTRKGIVIASNATKVNLFGITNDEAGPTTLLGLVQVFEGTVANGFSERSYIFNMFNDSVPVETEFEYQPAGGTGG
jgi:hypothetical protein